MSRASRVHWAIPGVALLVGAGLVAALVALAIGWSPLGRPAAISPPPASPTFAPTPSAGASASDGGAANGIDPASAAWFRLNAGTLGYGTLDRGHAGSIDLEGSGNGTGLGPPWAAGPVGGRIFYASARGDALGLVDVVSGKRIRVAGPRGSAFSGVLDPRGQFAYVVLHDAGQDGGIWRLALDGSSQPELVMPPDPTLAARSPTFMLAAPIMFHEQLAISPDGRELGLVACETTCSARWLDLSSGERRASDGANVPDDLTGVAGALLLSSRGSVDTRTWQPVDLEGLPLMTPDGIAVLTATSLVRLDGSVTPRPPTTLELVAVEQLVLPGSMGVDLPIGWALQVEHFPATEQGIQACDGQFVAFSLADATTVPLPVLGKPGFCG